MKNKSDGEPIYRETFLKTRIKSCCDEYADFHDKELIKLVPNLLGVVLIDFVLKKR